VDTLNNIVILPSAQGTNSLQDQTSGLSQDDLIAFISALVQSAGQTGTDSELAAKLSQLVKEKKLEGAEVLKLLQQMPAGQDDKLLKRLAAMLKSAPEVKPSLTSDLTSGLSMQLQDAIKTADPENILQTLHDKFAELGDVTPDQLAHFRQDAIELLKDMGLSPGEIEGMLVRLAMDLGPMLSDEQATLLMMPFRPDLPAEASPKAEVAVAKPAPITPQQLAEQQLQAAAQSPAMQKPVTRPASTPEKASAPAPQQPAPPQAPAQPQADAQAAKPAAQASSNLALVNSFAGEDGFNGGFGGQSFGQGTGYMTGGAAGGLQTSANASAESFVNYINTGGANGASSTQMIALQIQRNAQAQVDTFRMQLQPAELGKLEVKLKFGRDGSLKAHLIADKADTLTLLQKDQTQLQRALQQAGLNVDDGALSFDLRQQHQQDTNRSYNGRGQGAGNDTGDDLPATAALQAKIAVEAMGSISQGGVNIMV